MYLVVILSILAEALIYSGFCFEKLRYISEEEKKEIAIKYIIQGNREVAAKYKDRAVIYPFNTVDEFFRAEPSICDVFNGLRGGLDWIDKALGHFSSYVILEFKGSYHDKPQKVLGVVLITNCGDAYEED